jgi:transcriptional regulator with XRE-family HTH domain
MSIGTTVKLLRTRKGLTQAQLAKRIGVVQNRITDIERDRRGDNYTLRTLKTLADALDAELIIKFKVRENGNAIATETLGQLQPQGNERDEEGGATDRPAAASI